MMTLERYLQTLRRDTLHDLAKRYGIKRGRNKPDIIRNLCNYVDLWLPFISYLRK